VRFAAGPPGGAVREVHLAPGLESAEIALDVTTRPPLTVRVAGAKEAALELRSPWEPDREVETRTLGDGGVLEIADLPAGPVELRAVAPRTASRWETVGPERTEVTLEIPPHRPMQWDVPPASAGSPPDGTALTVVPERTGGRHPFPDEVRFQRGRIVAEGVGHEHGVAWAVAPEGTRARLVVKPDGSGGLATRFRFPRRIDLRLREADGSPVVGAQVRNRSVLAHVVGVTAPTDVDGRTSITVVGSGECELVVEEGARSWRDLVEVNLASEFGPLDVTLPPRQDVVLKVTIDGKPGLPSEYVLRCASQEVEDAAEDAQKGEIRFRARPRKAGDPVTVQFEAWGFFPEEGFTEQGRVFGGWSFPAAYRKAEVGPEVTLALRRAGQLRLSLTGRNEAGGRRELVVERRVGEEWRKEDPPGRPMGLSAGRGEDDRVVHLTLDRGRWRVRDPKSGRATEPFDLPAPSLVVERTLDLGP
jgi:hypothetical protein